MRLPEVVLKDAAHEIERRGWFQGDYVGPDGSVCVIGAIRAACGMDPHTYLFREESDMEHSMALELVAARCGYLRLSVHVWNDAPGRTVGEVLAVLKGE